MEFYGTPDNYKPAKPATKIKFYGQQGEDMLAWEIFKNSPPGFYVDVGAFDGVLFSNTYVFELQGWNGVCFEPNPEIYKLLQQNRKCTMMECLVGEKVSPGEPFAASTYDSISRRSTNPGDLSVPMVTLDYALTQLGVEHVDYISIDVEGWEREVLRGFDIKKYDPRLVIIEDNDGYQEMYDYFEKNGYILGRRQYFNPMYVKTKEDAILIATLPTNMENGQLKS